MIREHPRPTRHHHLIPSTTIFRSGHGRDGWLIDECDDLDTGQTGRYFRSETGRTAAVRRNRDDCTIQVQARVGGTIFDLAKEDCSGLRSEEHTSEIQSLMRISYDVFCL